MREGLHERVLGGRQGGHGGDGPGRGFGGLARLGKAIRQAAAHVFGLDGVVGRQGVQAGEPGARLGLVVQARGFGGVGGGDEKPFVAGEGNSLLVEFFASGVDIETPEQEVAVQRILAGEGGGGNGTQLAEQGPHAGKAISKSRGPIVGPAGCGCEIAALAGADRVGLLENGVVLRKHAVKLIRARGRGGGSLGGEKGDACRDVEFVHGVLRRWVCAGGTAEPRVCQTVPRRVGRGAGATLFLALALTFRYRGSRLRSSCS